MNGRLSAIPPDSSIQIRIEEKPAPGNRPGLFLCPFFFTHFSWPIFLLRHSKTMAALLIHRAFIKQFLTAWNLAHLLSLSARACKTLKEDIP
jgi:hypothetical protein